jgi:hypothetical protein
MNASIISHENSTLLPLDAMTNAATATAPQWMVEFVNFRQRLFMRTVEPIIVTLLGPAIPENEYALRIPEASSTGSYNSATGHLLDGEHRRLTFSFDFMPNYVEDPYAFRETSMSFATLTMLFVLMGCVLAIFLSCFYHNQKTSPLFISPRRHRLPNLVPPPLPIDGYFDWVSTSSLV